MSLAPEPQQRGGLSAGDGFAISGICFAAAVLTIFFCLLNFTDLLAPGTTEAMKEVLKSDNGGRAASLLMLITFSPLIGGFFLCMAVIKKD